MPRTSSFASCLSRLDQLKAHEAAKYETSPTSIYETIRHAWCRVPAGDVCLSALSYVCIRVAACSTSDHTMHAVCSKLGGGFLLSESWKKRR